MAGAMRKMGVYLGLLADAEGEYAADQEPGAGNSFDSTAGEPTQATVVQRARPVSDLNERRRQPARGANQSGTQTGGQPTSAVAPLSRITTLHPRTYNEARVIGENYRDGIPVIMDLSEMSDADAKRLVDFAAGLVFSVHGQIERVTSKVFLLSPPHVSIGAEEKERIVEGGFFNQS